MTQRSKPRCTMDGPKHARATGKPICRRLFTIEQATVFAGVPVRMIGRLIMTHRLEASVLAGGVRIDEVELADCLSPPASKQP